MADWWDNITGLIGGGIRALAGVGQRAIVDPVRSALSGLQQVGSSLLNVITHPLTDLTTAVGAAIATVRGDIDEAIATIGRIFGYTNRHQVNPLKSWVSRQLARLWAAVFRARAYALFVAISWAYLARVYARRLVTAERAERIRDFRRAEAYTRARVTAALTLVQREAATGYQSGYSARVATLRKLLDDVVTRDPLLKDIVSRAAGILLDLASVDDPLLRWLGGWLLGKLADDLGIDKALGGLVSALAGPLLGQPHPKNLHDVIKDLSDRMNAVEQQWAQFMADGGPQILQAGQEWKSITSVLADIGLLGFASAAVVDPAGAARDLSAVLRPIGTTVISDVARFLGEGQA